MRPRTVPVVLLAGHLGAGKTTLVNHLLRHAGGRRIGVVVNDFGATPVDAVLVAGQADAVASLADGCLCCEVDAGGLAALLGTLTAPRARLDLVLVEASGLAEPRELVRMLLDAARDEAAHAVYGGLVVAVDGVEFPTRRRTHPELVEHVRVADLVVVTKTDRVAEPSVLAQLVRELRSLAAGAVVPVAHGALDPALLAEPAPDRPRSAQLSFDALLDVAGDHTHARYESLEHTPDGPLDPARFVALLEAGLPGVFRLKGFARFAGDARTWEVQVVGTALRFRPAPRGARAGLVVIGAGLDRPALVAALEGCRAQGPVGEYAMLPVFRYN